MRRGVVSLRIANPTWGAGYLSAAVARQELAEHEMRDVAAASLLQRMCVGEIRGHASGSARPPSLLDMLCEGALPPELCVLIHPKQEELLSLSWLPYKVPVFAIFNTRVLGSQRSPKSA